MKEFAIAAATVGFYLLVVGWHAARSDHRKRLALRQDLRSKLGNRI